VTQPAPPSPTDATRTSASRATPSEGVGRRDADPEVAATQQRDPKRYRMLGEHGRGGLGRVSRAHDVELGRDVAIKELISRGNISEVRFLREALITARLEHPGIVPVHEAGRWPDGTPFYAMKLVAGRSLRELIAERNTVDARIGLLHHVIAVADAIAYAHGRNIIHRDLKPANVIVGDFGETVVIDWGLAKDLSDSEETLIGGGPFRAQHDDGLTSTGTILGTPAYMAPEQQRGEPVDQRADVYAIGAMLWELCVLEKLPPGATDRRRELLRTSSIDPDLLAIVDKAIDPNPQHRYPDAGALAADLKAFKAGARIAGRRYSPWAMLVHWTRRHRALALAVASAVVVFAAGSALYVSNVATERDRADASDIAARTSLNELTLRHAELLLATDPSAAIDALATYRGADVDRERQIRAEAIGRGVATLRAAPHNDAIRWVRGTSDGAIMSLSRDGTIARTTRDGRSQVIVDDVRKDGALAYAASRHLLAYACDPDDVCLLDITTGRRGRPRLGAASYSPSELSFSPDGSQLALLSTIGDLWILSVEGVNLLAAQPPFHPGRAGGMLFLERDAIALGGSEGLTLVRAGGQVQSLPDRNASLWDRGLDDHQLVISTVNGELYLVGTDDLKITRRTQLCRDPVAGLRTIRAAGAIAYMCKEGTLGLWDPRTGRITPKAHLDGHARWLVATSSGEYLFAAGSEGVVTRIDLVHGITARLRGHVADLTAIAPPTAEHSMAISGDAHGRLREWPESARLATLLADVRTPVFSALYDPQRSTVLAVTDRPALMTYSAAEGVRDAAKHTKYTQFVATATDGRRFATYGSSPIVELWSLSPLVRTATLDTQQVAVTHAQFVANTSELVTSGRDGRLLRWSGSSPRELHRFEHAIDTFAIACDGSIIVATHDGALWRAGRDGATALHPPGTAVSKMLAMPDCATIAIGRVNGTIEMLEPYSGQRVTTANGSEAIRDIAVARNGEVIAVAVGDGTVRLGRRQGNWFASTWTTLALKARRVAFTRDGLLMSIGADGAVWLYAPRLHRWGFVQASAAELTALALDEHDATAFVFDVDGRLMSVDVDAIRKQITHSEMGDL
jgi:WD40 repeat protein